MTVTLKCDRRGVSTPASGDDAGLAPLHHRAVRAALCLHRSLYLSCPPSLPILSLSTVLLTTLHTVLGVPQHIDSLYRGRHEQQ